MLEFTDIILKYSDMMQHYNVVHFEWAIEVLDTLPPYIQPVYIHTYSMNSSSVIKLV